MESASTIPRELSLAKNDKQYYLTSKPVRELGDLRIPADTLTARNLIVSGEKEISTGKVTLMQSELFFGFNVADSKADSIGIVLENKLNERLIIGYTKSNKQLYIDRNNAGNSAFSKEFTGISRAPYIAGSNLKLHMIVDASSVELFVDDGGMVMTTIVFPTEKFNILKVFSKGGETTMTKAVMHGLDRIWH